MIDNRQVCSSGPGFGSAVEVGNTFIAWKSYFIRVKQGKVCMSKWPQKGV